jgi:ubiquinone/menaquinone biosynthesis C-methylase UbiE
MRDLDKFGDETFSHVVTSLVLVMLKEQEDLLKAARELYRVLQDGGACVATSLADK